MNDTPYRSEAVGVSVGATVGLGVEVGPAVATAVGVCVGVSAGVRVELGLALGDDVRRIVGVAIGKVVRVGLAAPEQAASKNDVANTETEARTATSCIIGFLGSHSSKEGLVLTSSIS